MRKRPGGVESRSRLPSLACSSIAFQFAGVVAGGRQLAQCTNCGLSFPLTGIARETGASAPHASREKSRPGMQHATIVPDSATKVTNQVIRALRLVGSRLAGCATEPSVISEGGCTARCPVRGPAHCKRQSEQSQFFWYRNPFPDSADHRNLQNLAVFVCFHSGAPHRDRTGVSRRQTPSALPAKLTARVEGARGFW